MSERLYTQEEVIRLLQSLTNKAGAISAAPALFGPYIVDYNETYKTKQESLTKINRDRIIKNHILPKWGNTPMSEIKVNGLQKWFNDLEEQGYAHETMVKIRNSMSPALDAAVEEELIPRNPLKSNRLTIGGRPVKMHKAIPAEKMVEIRTGIPSIENKMDQAMIVLLAYTGMRHEEVLGLKWEDIDFEDGWIHIQRAVVHPDRNNAEIKKPKTKTSNRKIPLPNPVRQILEPQKSSGLIVSKNGVDPLSYTSSRNSFNRIRKMFSIQEYSAHDFRDTCATEWREQGLPLDVISNLLGHSKADITQQRYVKYRDEIFTDARRIMGATEQKSVNLELANSSERQDSDNGQ